jgi:hypothetical protein
MINILFDRATLVATGMGRMPLPFEVEVKNVDLTDLKKEVKYTEFIDKKIIETLEDGSTIEKQLYLLPQEDKQVINEIIKRIETTESTDENGNPLEPVIHQVTKQTPVLDENGNQVEYIPTALMETTETIDFYGNPTDPVMIQIEEVDESTGEIRIVEKQKTDENGNLVYMGMMAVSDIPVKCFTTELVEEQKKDADGNLLYYKDVIEEVITYESQPPLEITEDDERFMEGLEKAKVEVEKTKIVTFEEDMNVFTYEDIVKHKEALLTKGTFFTKATLFENPENVVDNSSSAADLGFNMISIPSNKEVTTIAIQLPNATDLVGIYFEASDDGIEVEIGESISELKPINQRNEVYFDELVSEVYVCFKNSTNNRIDLYSFGLLV